MIMAETTATHIEENAMPETDAPNMEYIRFAVPAPLLQQAAALANAEGWKPAELYRTFWERGFAAYCEGSNKRLVNQKLRDQLEGGTEVKQSDKDQ